MGIISFTKRVIRASVFLGKAALLDWLMADDSLADIDFGPEDLEELLPYPLDDGFQWIIDPAGMREIILIAQNELDPDHALLTILAHTNYPEPEPVEDE